MNGDRIERELRQRGPREAGGALPPLPSDVAEARARLSSIDRRRGLRLLVGGSLGTLAAAAAVVAVVVAIGPGLGLGAGDTKPSILVASGGPSVTGSPEPGVIPPCAVADLRAQAATWGAAAGSRGTSVTLTNAGSAACRLAGRPGAIIDAATGTVVSVAGDPGTGPGFVLDPGASALTSVVWTNWCAADPAGPLSVSLLIDGAHLEVTPDAAHPDVLVPPCMGSEPTSLSTIDFQHP